eukprot:SAG22_NODE_20327_length_266_cov_1.221557_1_plen_44_part_10
MRLVGGGSLYDVECLEPVEDPFDRSHLYLASRLLPLRQISGHCH